MTNAWTCWIAAAALAATGCSFSYSSKSLSESSASSSKSSTSSSGGEGEATSTDTAYRNDVRDQTVAFVEAGESVEALQANVGDVARRYGITDWEADPQTYLGMGAGLATAKVHGARLAALERALADDDPEHQRTIRRGYESVGR